MARFIYAKNYNEVLNGIRGQKFFIFGQSDKAMVYYLASMLDDQEENFTSFVLSDTKRCKYKEYSMVGHSVEDIEWLKSQKNITCGFIGARPVIIESDLRKLFDDIDMDLYYVDDETYAVEKTYYDNLVRSRIRDNYYVRTDWNYGGCLRLSEQPNSNYYMYMPKGFLGIYPDAAWLGTPTLDVIHEAQFGKYERLPECKDDNFNPKCKIYMAKTAFDRELANDVRSENAVVIQGGADLTFDRIGMIQDNDGENISKRNRDYCEMTSVYWAWKNDTESEYIGLCHYRRRFILTKNMINAMIENKYDVVATTPYLENNTVYEEFCTQNWFLNKEEWNQTAEAIQAVAAEYLDSWNELAQSHMFLPCNMVIMRRDIFNQYCKLVFDVTAKVDEYFMRTVGQKNNRYLGYIAELLTNVFVMKHRDTLKKAYVDMQILNVK